MMVDVSEYTLVLANRSQVVQHLEASHKVWGRGRDFNEAVRQYDRQRSHAPWGDENKFLVWVLVKRSDPAGEIYAGCGTMRRGAFVRDWGEDRVRDTVHYAIVSVVTPIQHLRNGYATHMLRLLHYALGDKATLPPFPSQWGTPPPALPSTPQQLESAVTSDKSASSSSSATLLDGARPSYLPAGIGSLLWSDVGYDFYAKCTIGADIPGWTASREQCVETLWDIQEPKLDALDGWEVLYQKDLESIKPILAEANRQKLLAGPSDKPLWCPDPSTPGGLAFLQFTLPILSDRPEKELAKIPVAIRRQFPDTDGDTIVVVAFDNKMMGDFMLATYIHNLPPKHVAAMLDALDVFGTKAGYTRGWAFDINEKTELAKAWAAVPGRTVEHRPRADRHGHVLGVAWYGKPEPRGELVDGQMWGCC